MQFLTIIILVAFSLTVSSLSRSAVDKLDVALPNNATINFKDGKQISGARLIEVNLQGIKYSKGGNSESRTLNQIKSITFTGNYEILAENALVVRGASLKKCSEQKPMTIPVNDFRVQNGTRAAVNLSSLPPITRKALIQIRKNKGFVVKELQFDGKGTINITSAACAVQ